MRGRRRVLVLLVTALFCGACQHPRLRPAPRPQSAVTDTAERVQRLRLALFDAGYPEWDAIRVTTDAEGLILSSPEDQSVDLEWALRILQESGAFGPVRRLS